ncbi:hypothetical protein F4781DRAFT_309523 [Annulohypoxylon bovei var. microspora]|nr:hypothetical protein F4781DRAFT_309523 [Annulohypoxylon bovei var. microspora]
MMKIRVLKFLTLAGNPRRLIIRTTDDEVVEPGREMRECNACMEMKDAAAKLARAPCGHEYCRRCLGQLFKAAASDEERFPARCCRQLVPFEPNEAFLDPWLVLVYRSKAAEFITPLRTYCHNPACSTFISSHQCKNNVAKCHICAALTCTFCGGRSHEGDCPYDENLHKLMELAKHKGWRQCPGCRMMVERENGCVQMNCRCRAQFCYRCGLLRKDCECTKPRS